MSTRFIARATPRAARAIAMVATVALAACTAPSDVEEPAAAEPITRDELVVAVRADLSGVNELLSSSGLDHEIRSNLFLSLLQEQPDYQEHPPTFAPQLAESYEFSDDRLQLTFDLRPDAVWSDGTPITAHDVRWTWEAHKSPEVGWAYGYVKESIVDVEVVDDQTAVFHFDRSYPAQLIDANEGFVLPRHVWSELPFESWSERADWFSDHAVTSGPYTIGTWTRDQEIVLDASPTYFGSSDGVPGISRVVFRIIPDESSRLAQFLAGEVDVMRGVPPSRAAEIEARPDLRIAAVWARHYAFLVWNTENELFEDAELRRALTMAIDREALIEALWFGRARPGVSPIPTDVWAHNSDLAPWPHDPEQTIAILEARGWTRGEDGIFERDGARFEFELTTNTGNQLRRDALVLIQEQLRRAGIAAQPRFVDGQSLISLNMGHMFDVTLGAWAIDTSLDYSYAFHSDEIATGYNYGSYSSPEVDELLEAIASEASPVTAKPLFDQLQELIHRDQPYTFLWEPQSLVGVNARVRDATPNALLTFQTLPHWRLD